MWLRLKKTLDRMVQVTIAVRGRKVPRDAGPMLAPVAGAIAGESVNEETHRGISSGEWAVTASARDDEPAREVLISQRFTQRNETLHLVSQ